MKLDPEDIAEDINEVTPRAGVWIEILKHRLIAFVIVVTPRAGVWIEIFEPMPAGEYPVVTPRAGVWIEI